MGSHQSQSASYSTGVSSLCSSVRGSCKRGNNGVLWLNRRRRSCSSCCCCGCSVCRSHVFSHSERCFAMSACLLIRESQNGREQQLRPGRGLGPLREGRINVAAVSGGTGALGVWCQKQLIGFSLHSVQSTVTSTQHTLHTKDEWMNGEMSQRGVEAASQIVPRL